MADDDIIRGRAEIADALGRSEKTVTAWIKLGILPARKAGPFPNNALVVRQVDVARLRHRFGSDCEPD